MNGFKDFLNESKIIRLYHGDNHKTDKIKIKNMMMGNSNAQEGVGIYFSPKLETAESYGKNIIYCDVDKSKFFDSRQDIGKYMKSSQFLKMIKEFEKTNKEDLFYLISDYSEVSEPSELNTNHYLNAWNLMKDDEVRNFQITMAQTVGTINFVKVWNKIFPDNLGTHGKPDDFYAIINPKVKVYSYKGE